jgi:hypothetical protein
VIVASILRDIIRNHAAGKRCVAPRVADRTLDEFIDELGPVTCGEIQKKTVGRAFSLLDPNDCRAVEDAGGHNSVCATVVATATRRALEITMEDRQSLRG